MPRKGAGLVQVLGEGEYGGGLSAYLYIDADGTSILVDCGAPPEANGRTQEILRNLLTYPRCQGVVVTHPHYDHWSHLWMLSGLQVFMSRLVLQLIMKQDEFLRRDRLPSLLPAGNPFQIFEPGTTFTVGTCTVTTLKVPHSVPDASVMLIRFPSGKVVLHATDFKFHGMTTATRRPLEEELRAAGALRIVHMTTDLFNAHVAGFTPPEEVAIAGIEEVTRGTSDRVLIASFSTNLARLTALRDVAYRLNRPVEFDGSSMRFMASWLPRSDCMSPSRERPPVVFVTGCQGEPGSVLWKAVNHSQPRSIIGAGDTVIISARTIGNEDRVRPVIQGLLTRGAQVVVHEGEISKLGISHPNLREACVHVSGHGAAGDLQLALRCVRPARVMPQPPLAPQLAAFRTIAEAASVSMMEPPADHIVRI